MKEFRAKYFVQLIEKELSRFPSNESCRNSYKKSLESFFNDVNFKKLVELVQAIGDVLNEGSSLNRKGFKLSILFQLDACLAKSDHFDNLLDYVIHEFKRLYPGVNPFSHVNEQLVHLQEYDSLESCDLYLKGMEARIGIDFYKTMVDHLDQRGIDVLNNLKLSKKNVSLLLIDFVNLAKRFNVLTSSDIHGFYDISH